MDATLGSLITAIIAAVAAIIGILVGQVLQNRREARNWDRQAIEQRRRDAEQREDQRIRDREVWRREDRNRFIADKRDIYLSYLASADRVLWATGNAASLMKADLGRDQRGGARAWFESHELIGDIDRAFEDWGASYSRLQLLASPELDDLARAAFHGAFGVYTREMLTDGDCDSVLNTIDRLRQALREVQATMRADLTPD